jgi:hypothetical protein
MENKVMVDLDIIKQIYTQQAKQAIADEIKDSLWEAWAEETLSEVVENKVNKMFDKGIDDIIKDSVKETTTEWLICNIYSKRDVEHIIKGVIIEKLKEFSFEELKTLLMNVEL